MTVSRLVRRMMPCAVSVTLVLSMITVGITASAPSARAAGTVLFDQPFHDKTVDGPAGSVSLPTAPTPPNAACLTARGNTSTTGPLFTCGSSTDNNGSGKLRFTSTTTFQEGGVFASTSVPTSQGLDVTFNSYQYGGTGADGLAFVLAAVNPGNPVIPTAIGQPGGALGYSAASSSLSGLTNGYLGVGFDTFGNFSNKYEGTGCTDPANITKAMPGQVVVRGPGNGTVGYCALQSSAATATSPALTLRASTRSASLVPVEVVFNPGSSSVTTDSGLVVPAGDYDVTFTPVGGTAKTLLGALPVVPSGLYPSSWVNGNGIPKQLAFGWGGVHRLGHGLPRDRQRGGQQLQRGPAARRLPDELRGVDARRRQPRHVHGRGQFLGREPAGDGDADPARPASCRSAPRVPAGPAPRRAGRRSRAPAPARRSPAERSR